MDNAPARSAELLRQRRVDAALVPVIEYQRMTDILLVPNVCVGAKEKVRSVCLVTKGEYLSDVKTIALDVSSRTSVGLTKIIFSEFFSKEPIYKEAKPNIELMLAESDCALLIGDPALTIDETIYRKFDLAETWRKFTNFGFVFAMWMTSADKAEIAKSVDFQQIRDEGLAHLDEIIANYQSQIALDNAEFKTYLSENISYSIDDSMEKGLSLYFEMAHKHKLIEHSKPLRFLD